MAAVTDPDPVHRAGSGEPLVLLHGFTDTWRAWTRVLPALEARHEVFAWSLPGHSGGEPWDRSLPFSNANAVTVLERQLDDLGIERAHLVGSSLGGWMALELAARGRALSVVGVCPAGGWEPGAREQAAAARYFRRNQRLGRWFHWIMPLVARVPWLRRLVLRDLIADPRGVTEEEALAMFAGARGCTVVDDVLALAAERDPWGELTAIACPVTILYGTKDRILRWPAYYSRMRRMLPDANWVALEGLGHLPMWDAPDVVTEAILRQTAKTESGTGSAYRRDEAS